MTRIRPRWIVFDAADTLLRPEPSVAAVYQQIAAEYGVRTTRDEVKQRFAPAIRKHFADEISSESLDRQRWQRLVFDVLQTTNQHVFDRLWEHFAEPASWRLFEDVDPTWQQLRESGFDLAIASNFDARLLNIVAAMPSISKTPHIFISSQLGYRKPSRLFFQQIEQRLSCSGTDLLMVGDSKHADFDGARSAGWQALHLSRSSVDADLPVISTLASLCGLWR